MRFLLDTNVMSDLIRNPQGRIAERIKVVDEANVCTSIVVAAELRYGAAKKASSIGGNDLIIAAQALAFDITLVTDNEREFSRIDGLRIENWLRN